MRDIFTYIDFRKYLRDFIAQKQSSVKHFSLRYLANKIGINISTFSRVLQNKRNISIKLAIKIAKALKLNKRESEYFQNLVLFCQSASHPDKKMFFERLMSFKESQVRILHADQYEFYQKWYYTAVREILNFYPFRGDFNELAQMVLPPISPTQAKKAVQVLEKVGLIKKKKDSSYSLTDTIISTGYETKSVAINNHITNYLKLAQHVLEKHTKENKNLSCVSISISEQGFKTIQDELRAFRRRILEIAKNDKTPNRAYNFNFQIFPLSKPFTGDAK